MMLNPPAHLGAGDSCTQLDLILNMLVQEFAWTEEELLSKIKTRASSLPESAGLMQEPMFCYETALKAYYFAHLMYSYQSVSWPAQ